MSAVPSVTGVPPRRAPAVSKEMRVRVDGLLKYRQTLSPAKALRRACGLALNLAERASKYFKSARLKSLVLRKSFIRLLERRNLAHGLDRLQVLLRNARNVQLDARDSPGNDRAAHR